MSTMDIPMVCGMVIWFTKRPSGLLVEKKKTNHRIFKTFQINYSMHFSKFFKSKHDYTMGLPPSAPRNKGNYCKKENHYIPSQSIHFGV